MKMKIVQNPLSKGLTANGIAVCRDQQNLQAGQNWPEELGKAIATMLAAVESARSNFVETEGGSAK